MARKIRTYAAGMWINLRSNLNGGHHVEWNRRRTDRRNARYLELANVMLGQEPPSKSLDGSKSGRNLCDFPSHFAWPGSTLRTITVCLAEAGGDQLIKNLTQGS